MSKKTLTASVVALAMMALLASTALAGPYGPGRGQGPNAPQLTQEQIAKIEQDRAAFMDATLGLRKQIAEKQVEMRTLMAQPKVDKAKFSTLANELIDLRAQMAKERIKYMGDDVNQLRGYGAGLCGGRGSFGGRGTGMGSSGRGGRMGGFGGGPGGGNCWQ